MLYAGQEMLLLWNNECISKARVISTVTMLSELYFLGEAVRYGYSD